MNEPIIASLLDSDIYKLYTQAAIHAYYPKQEAIFRYTCRTKNAPVGIIAHELREIVNQMGDLVLTGDELAYLMHLGVFRNDYLTALQDFQLNPRHVEITTTRGADGGFDNGLSVTITGNWFETTLWEVPLLAAINELFYKRFYAYDYSDALDEGQGRLERKVVKLYRHAQNYDAVFPVVEFGTRRRFSREHQNNVMRSLKAAGIAKTSNAHLARTMGLEVVGTMPHEWFMGHQALAPIQTFQQVALRQWAELFPERLRVALTDTIGRKAFWRDFDHDLAYSYKGCRHDSGDPEGWMDGLLNHYDRHKIDPSTKLAVFSDGLDLESAEDLWLKYRNRMPISFGIGTSLTNDMGLPTLPNVIKLVSLDGQPVAKISDTPEKAMCDDPTFLAHLKKRFGVDPTSSAVITPEMKAGVYKG